MPQRQQLFRFDAGLSLPASTRYVRLPQIALNDRGSARVLGRWFVIALFGVTAHLRHELLFALGKSKKGLFQPQAPLATLLVVSLLGQRGAGCGLSPQEFCSCHFFASPTTPILQCSIFSCAAQQLDGPDALIFRGMPAE